MGGGVGEGGSGREGVQSTGVGGGGELGIRTQGGSDRPRLLLACPGGCSGGGPLPDLSVPICKPEVVKIKVGGWEHSPHYHPHPHLCVGQADHSGCSEKQSESCPVSKVESSGIYCLSGCRVSGKEG